MTYSKWNSNYLILQTSMVIPIECFISSTFYFQQNDRDGHIMADKPNQNGTADTSKITTFGGGLQAHGISNVAYDTESPALTNISKL